MGVPASPTKGSLALSAWVDRPVMLERMGVPAVPTIAVIDDHAGFRRATRAIADAAGCMVVGEAEDAEHAKALLSSVERPDLVLMDVNLGGTSGIDLTRELVAADPQLRVVLVSTMAEADIPADALASGAERFVAKSQLAPEVLMALTATPPGGGCQGPHEDAT